VGARADALVVDGHESALLGIPGRHTLDALVFSSPARPWQGVMVAGQWQIRQGKHAHSTRIAHAFEAAMAQLWCEA
jgi:formimidoylglutamate deiminase